jgi:hypothetical protein
MGWIKGLLSNGGVIDKVTGIVSKSVVDKDQRNQLVFEIALLMMQSQIAKYVRAALSLISVVAIMFFGDGLTLTPDKQEYVLYTIYGYYFLDRVFSSKLGK